MISCYIWLMIEFKILDNFAVFFPIMYILHNPILCNNVILQAAHA